MGWDSYIGAAYLVYLFLLHFMTMFILNKAIKTNIFNRPGVAGAVLQTPS